MGVVKQCPKCESFDTVEIWGGKYRCRDCGMEFRPDRRTQLDQQLLREQRRGKEN